MFDNSDFEAKASEVPPSMMDQATPAAVALWRGLLRRKWLILALTLLGLILGYAATRFMTPLYQAVATVLVEFGQPKVVSVEEVYAGYGKDREHYQTQVQYMQSREVGLRVIRDLDLVNDPEFAGAVAAARARAGDRPQDPVTVPAPALQTGVPADGAVRGDPGEEAALAVYLANLEVEPIRQSQLVLVKYRSEDPVLAARIANKVGESFVLAEMDMRLQMTVSANSWLAGRVAELKQRLDQSEQRLAEFRESANLVDRRGGLGTTTQQLDELSQRLVEASVRRTQAEQAWNLVRPGAAGREDASPVSADVGVRRARDVLADADARFTAARSRYGPSHPAYETAQAEVEQAREALRRQIDSVYTTVNKDYQAAVATEQSLRKTLDTVKRQSQRDNRYEAQAGALEQEVEANRTLYQTFLQRLKETSMAADAQRPVARVVDTAVAPSQPVSPRVLLVTVAAGLAGFLSAIAIAFLLNKMDRSIRSIEELESVIGEPLMAALPLLPKSLQNRRGRLVLDEPDEFFSEAVRMAAASLHFSALDRRVKSIAITSAVAPSQPVSPRVLLVTVAAGLAGFLSAIAIAFLLNKMDRSIRSIEELESAIGEPLMAALPLLPKSLQSRRGRLVLDEPDEFFSEAVRMAAASLHFSALDRRVKSIAITSAVASEGKSTFAVNLSLALARTSRVLLIDADLFRSNVHRLLGTRNPKNGLARVLMGDVEAKDAVLRYPGSQLWVMPSGPVQGRAYGVLTPLHFRRLVKQLEEHFDFVIVDAPPVEVLSDATAIAGSCSATVLVTRAGQTPLPLLQKAMRRLRRINARMLGVVLSGHDFDKARRLYGEESGFESYKAYGAYGQTEEDLLREPPPPAEPRSTDRPRRSQAASSGTGLRRAGPLPVPAKIEDRGQKPRAAAR